MTWIVPNEDAVTLGELHGELYSVSKRDDARIGDEFIRRGGSVFPPARVATIKPRPFGQTESLTTDQDTELDVGALKLLKRALKAIQIFLMDDELNVLNCVLGVAQGAMQKLLKSASDDNDLELLQSASNANGESIVDLSWHPRQNMLAVARLDGVVALYHVENASWDARVVTHPEQMDICSIEWGEFTGNTLAVACRTGLFIWQIPLTKKEPELQEILHHPSKAGFSQVCWNAEGTLLAAFSKASNRVIVFDAIFSRRTELQSPSKLASLHWSPTGEYLFVTTEAEVCLMWETLTWKRETWDIAVGACGWSSDGQCLLVGLRNSTFLYPYTFPDCPPSLDAQLSSPPLDFAEKKLYSLDRSTSALVGGMVRDIAWDPTGARVAVTYQSSGTGSGHPGTSKLVAIFTVAWQPFLIFTHSGLLRGPPNAGIPRKLAFASNFEQGALLSVVWSSGLISFHPFYLGDQSSGELDTKLVAVAQTCCILRKNVIMSIYDEAFSCADYNNLDDPKVHHVCDVDQTKHYQLPELGKFATKTAETMPFVEHLPSSSPSPPAPNKQSGPRPVDHAKALRQFFNLGRERNPNLVASELTLFERDIALREISKNQLRKYMLATDEEDPVDLKEWGRYELGPPKQVPTCDVNEVAERAAQLKLYCRWRKRVVQKRLEVRRQQLEAVHLALMKKHKGVHRPLLSLGSVWGSSKTAIADTSFLEEEQASTVTNKNENAKKTTVDD